MNKNTTHRDQTDVIETVLQLLLDHDQNALAEDFRLLVNEAMKAERNYALNAAPYERAEVRLGYAKGFKPKTVATRLGSLTFQVPQVRGLSGVLSIRSAKRPAERACSQAGLG